MWTIRQVVETVLLLVKGIWETTRSCSDFAELERSVKRLCQEATRRLLEAALESMDERLMQERDRKRLKAVRCEERTLVTMFGEVGGTIWTGRPEPGGTCWTRSWG